MIAAILVIFGTILVFVIWCCLRVGAMADARMDWTQEDE